jgi:hypothetical protein
MASSYDDNQNENSSIINNKNSKSPKDHAYDLDWIQNTNAKSFLPTDRHPLKKPIIDQGCQKRLSKYNGIVNRLTSEQVDDELKKRQLSTRLNFF